MNPPAAGLKVRRALPAELTGNVCVKKCQSQLKLSKVLESALELRPREPLFDFLEKEKY